MVARSSHVTGLLLGMLMTGCRIYGESGGEAGPVVGNEPTSGPSPVQA